MDAFKWSIYHDISLGVTLHYIDENVDIGEIVSVVPTPVFRSDTIDSLARRHYEQEINVLAEFETHLRALTNAYKDAAHHESMRHMRAETEREMLQRFARYKGLYADQ